MLHTTFVELLTIHILGPEYVYQTNDKHLEMDPEVQIHFKFQTQSHESNDNEL